MALQPMNEIRKRVAAAMHAFPDVRAVFLFGSMAEEQAKPRSDIDLAVISDAPDIRERRLDLLASLVAAGLDDVDLVFPDERDVVLRYEAIRLNCLLYARRDFDHGAYYSRALREYLDFLPCLEIQRIAFKKRVLNA